MKYFTFNWFHIDWTVVQTIMNKEFDLIISWEIRVAFLQLELQDTRDDEWESTQQAAGHDPLERGLEDATLGEDRVHDVVEDGNERENEDRVGHLHLIWQNLKSKSESIHPHGLQIFLSNNSAKISSLPG